MILLMATPAAAQTAASSPTSSQGEPVAKPETQLTHDQIMAIAKAAFGPRGRNLSYHEAKQELSKVRVGMDASIALLATCAPRGGDNVIRLGAKMFAKEQLHCSIGDSDEPLREIEALLEADQIVNLSYASAPASRGGIRITRATFMIFSVGMAGNGASTSISFQPDHPDCSVHIQKQDGIYVAIRALNPPLCTWLWEHDED